MDGSFATTVNNASRNQLSLHESFKNSMQFKSTIEVPRNEVLNIGKVGPYPSGSPKALPGGADQIDKGTVMSTKITNYTAYKIKLYSKKFSREIWVSLTDYYTHKSLFFQVYNVDGDSHYEKLKNRNNNASQFFFSLPYQKETLKRFCEIKKFNIIKHFQEDYSAKTFDRPEWKKLVSYCKANRKEIDTILFTKWDRFSRNAAEAYQGIVPKWLFYQVQDLLDGRKRKTKKWSLKDEHLPLRGHIRYSRCGKPLTGSASTGRLGGKYYYYHCRKGCKERFKVKEAHVLFDAYISSLTVSEGKAALYLEILKEQYGNNKEGRKRKITKMKTEIETLRQTIEKAEDNLFEGKIDMRSFNKGKAKYTQRIADLEFEIAELKAIGSRFMDKLQKAVEVFKNLKTFYDSGSWETKQMILGSTFPEKLIFEKNKYRTPRLNIVIKHIFQINSNLINIKKQTLEFLRISSADPQSTPLCKYKSALPLQCYSLFPSIALKTMFLAIS